MVAVVIAVSLMWLDANSKFFHRWHHYSAAVVFPIEYLVDLPVRVFVALSDDLVSREQLIAQNARLHAKELLLLSKLQLLLALQKENEQLHQLLASAVKIGSDVVVAQVLAAAINPFSQHIVINKGLHQAFVGQPVLDAYGVIGQVVSVGRITSQVMLLTDQQSEIPVQDSRSGVRTIVVGDGFNHLILHPVTQTADIKRGDLMVTSALGKRYPYGYPVGRVVNIEHNGQQSFATITASPIAHVNSSRLVLLVWPNNKTITAKNRYLFASHKVQG